MQVYNNRSLPIKKHKLKSIKMAERCIVEHVMRGLQELFDPDSSEEMYIYS